MRFRGIRCFANIFSDRPNGHAGTNLSIEVGRFQPDEIGRLCKYLIGKRPFYNKVAEECRQINGPFETAIQCIVHNHTFFLQATIQGSVDFNFTHILSIICLKHSITQPGFEGYSALTFHVRDLGPTHKLELYRLKIGQHLTDS